MEWSVENLSLFALIYLPLLNESTVVRWESFIIRLDILTCDSSRTRLWLRIFHYSPWYTYPQPLIQATGVENLSLFALIYLTSPTPHTPFGWESFIIRLDILTSPPHPPPQWLRIFHYSPWYTYSACGARAKTVENLSLFALIYL